MGNTSFHYAITEENPEIISSLIEMKGLNVNLFNIHGKMPVHTFFEKYNKRLHSTAGVGYLVTLNPLFDMGFNVQYHLNGRIQLSNHIGINIGNIACFASMENWNSLLSVAKKTQGISGQFGLNYVIKSNKSSDQPLRSKMNEKKFFRK
jgi:hypothetical protein